MLDRRRILMAALATPALPLRAQTPARDPAREWPQRPVKLVIGFPPGQATDVLIRVYAAELQALLKQPFHVENRPGAGGTLAVREVASAAPDGATLLHTSTGPVAAAPHLDANLGYDPLDDLAPVAFLGESTYMLLVRQDSPIRTLPELVEASRKRILNGGSGGNGVTNHLILEMFKSTSGAQVMHIPYKGAAPAMTDLIGGQIDTMFEAIAAALVHVRTGRLRALAVTSLKRHAALPDVPSVAEFYPGFEGISWSVMAFPRGVAPSHVDAAAAAIAKVQQAPESRARLADTGVELPLQASPQEVRRYMASEYRKWGEIIRGANIRLG